MGRPLVANSFDAWVTYPLVYKITPYVDVHPNYVTLLCIVFKVLCLAQSWAFSRRLRRLLVRRVDDHGTPYGLPGR